MPDPHPDKNGTDGGLRPHPIRTKVGVGQAEAWTLRSRRCASSRPAWSRSASEGVCCEASPQSGHPAARPWSEACCHPDTAGAGASGQKVELGIRPPHQLSGVLYLCQRPSSEKEVPEVIHASPKPGDDRIRSATTDESVIPCLRAARSTGEPCR